MRDGVLALPEPRRQHSAAFGVSMACHALALVLVILLRLPAEVAQHPATASLLAPRLVWIPQAGPGGGGGGGGAQSARPARSARRPGAQALAVPPPPAAIEPHPLESELPLERAIEAAVVPLAASTELARGVLESISSDAAGPGTQGGAGDGNNNGIGEGSGPGLGRGRNGNAGGGVRLPGNGVTTPILVHQVRPAFTIDAMRARVSGIAVLECVVNTDGSVSEIRIVRSLDPRYGLDQQAVAALKEWRFKPGTFAGEPVPVLVRVELAFSLR